jgi:hypothetical protein
MAKQVPIKVALIALLIGVAVVGRFQHTTWAATDTWLVVGFLAFAIFNVVVGPKGTLWVRVPAVLLMCAALLHATESLWIPAVLFAWLVWPPAFLVAWALERERAEALGGEPTDHDASTRRARISVAAIIAAVAVASLAYRLLVSHGLAQTSALFVGIPAILAIVVVFAVSPESSGGVACKAVTVGLLVSAMFLGEGFLCVIMSAPLFYLVAIAVASAIDTARSHGHGTTFSFVILLAIIPVTMEGVFDVTTVDRRESISESKVVRATPQQIERALFLTPRFDRVLPLYLRAGFPTPVATRIDRAPTGMEWVIRLRGGEMRLDGMEARSGDLVLALDEARPGLVRWRAVADSSHMTHFLIWREVIVEWRAVDAVNKETSLVTWTLKYDRGLDPAWYFGPWERYAVRLAARYLIDAVATP